MADYSQLVWEGLKVAFAALGVLATSLTLWGQYEKWTDPKFSIDDKLLGDYFLFYRRRHDKMVIAIIRFYVKRQMILPFIGTRLPFSFSLQPCISTRLLAPRSIQGEECSSIFSFAEHIGRKGDPFSLLEANLQPDLTDGIYDNRGVVSFHESGEMRYFNINSIGVASFEKSSHIGFKPSRGYNIFMTLSVHVDGEGNPCSGEAVFVKRELIEASMKEESYHSFLSTLKAQQRDRDNIRLMHPIILTPMAVNQLVSDLQSALISPKSSAVSQNSPTRIVSHEANI